jgi:hypothetical protein
MGQATGRPYLKRIQPIRLPENWTSSKLAKERRIIVLSISQI